MGWGTVLLLPTGFARWGVVSMGVMTLVVPFITVWVFYRTPT